MGRPNQGRSHAGHRQQIHQSEKLSQRGAEGLPDPQGGWFGILATGVDNLTIEGLKIDTNRDGMDIDCCHNVHVPNCSVNSPWDDALVLKSSYALGYDRSCENITIANCYVTGAYHLGTMLDATWKKFDAERAWRPAVSSSEPNRMAALRTR